MRALGILEVAANAASIVALDAMVKSCDVRFVRTEKALGGRLVTIIVEGSVSNVKQAIEVGAEAASKIGTVAVATVINSPHEEVQKILSTEKTPKQSQVKTTEKVTEVKKRRPRTRKNTKAEVEKQDEKKTIDLNQENLNQENLIKEEENKNE